MKETVDPEKYEQMLKESQDRYHALLEFSPEAIAVQQGGKVIYLNPAGLELFRAKDSSDIVGRNIFDFMDGQSDFITNDLISRLEERGQRLPETALTIRKVNGQSADVEVVSTPIMYQGKPAAQVVVRDITARTMAEKAMRFHADVLSQVSDAVVVVDNEQTIIYWNKGAERLYQYTASEVLGRRLEEINPYCWNDAGQGAGARNALNRNGFWRCEGVHCTKNGEKLHVESSVSVLKDESGVVLGKIAVTHDITDRIMLEKGIQAVRESEERYRSLVESSPEAICVQQDGLCVYMNTAGLELLGAGNFEEIEKKEMEHFIHPDFRKAAAHWLQQVAEKSRHAPSLQLKILPLNGQEVNAEAAGSLITFAGKPAVQLIIKDISRRENTELRLRLQATVLSQVNDAVVATGKDGRIIFWNKGAERLYKMSAEEAIGRRREEIYRYRMVTADEEAAKEPTASGFLRGENIHILRSGEEIYVESSVSVLTDWSNAPVGWLAVMRDVTERKIFDRKLRESEERYRSLVESSPDAILVHQYGKLVYVNPATLKLVRAKDLEELIGKDVLDFVHPDFQQRAVERFRQVVEESLPLTTRESKIIRLDGAVVHIEAVGTHIVYGGRPAIQIIAKDITERKKFEEALRNSEQLYRMMFESNPHPMWIYDRESLRFLFVNDAAVVRYGYSKEEFLSMTIKDIREAGDVSDLFDNVSKIAAGLHDEGNWRHKKKDGTIIDVEIISHNLKIEGKDARVVLAHDITERREAERALRESEERQRTVFDNSPIAIMAKDMQGRHILFNRQAEIWMNIKREEALGKTVHDLLPKKEADQCVISDQRVIETRAAVQVEEILELPDGKHTHLTVKFPLFDAAGSLYAVCTIVSDITEMKRAEQAIKEARDAAMRDRSKLEIILNTIPSAVFVAEGLDGVVTHQNEQAFLVLGRNVDNGLTAADRIVKYEMTKSDGSLFKSEELPYLRALLHGEDVRDVEITFRRPDRRKVTVLSNAAPLRDGEGNIIASVTAFSDITERKAAEDALRRARTELELRVRERTAELAATVAALQSEVAERKRTVAERDKLVAAVESTAEAIVVTDNRGIIQYVNPSFEQITGYQRQEAIGRDLHFLDSGQHDQDFFPAMRETIRLNGVWKGRLINKKKDGTIYYEDCTYSPVKDRSGNIVNYVSIKHDVTERLRLESIAETVDAMNNIGYVFAGIRHEIGNPVSSLLIILSLLKKKYDATPKETIREYVDQAIGQVERIEYLLKSLKNFNMYENLQIRSIEVSSFMEKFIPLVMADLTKKGIAFQVDEAAEAGWMSADPRALQQALLNVVVNASDAVSDRPDPKIVLSTLKAGGTVRIRVADNGMGITEDRKKELFKPFYTTKPDGTGLGLVITRKLISRMKGFIEIASRKDEGTIVDIHVPEGTVERIL